MDEVEVSLSPVWGKLPVDLVEHVFASVVDAHFYTDPAYTWVCLRRLSGHQKRVIEHRFADLWLPKLSITIYSGIRHKVDYVVDNEQSTENDDWATFKIQRLVHNPMLGISQDSMPGRLAQQYVRRAWERYNSTAVRNITVRLGEGYLSGGLRGGYIVNDTDIPGCHLEASGRIRFRWKDAVNELLREEMYMRRVGDEMFTAACNDWLTDSPQSPVTERQSKEHRLPPLKSQVKLWRFRVQFPRRVAALRHRAAKSRATAHPIDLKFAATSTNLHKQEPDPLDLKTVKNWQCCWECCRTQEPDIFEVAAQEESAVPQLGVFQRWLAQHQKHRGECDCGEQKNGNVGIDTIFDLYRHEFALTCQFADFSEEHDETEEQDEMQGYEKPKRGSNPTEGLEPIMVGSRKVRWEMAP